MPYITKQSEHDLYTGNSELPVPRTRGELNYLITTLMVSYLKSFDKINYDTISITKAVANDAATEFGRRLLDVYEDKKLKDVNNVDPYQALVPNSTHYYSVKVSEK